MTLSSTLIAGINFTGKGELKINGVIYLKSSNEWAAFIITPSGRRKHLGFFKDIREAARARYVAELTIYSERPFLAATKNAI